MEDYFMGDIMTPIPFGNLMNWILTEKSNGKVFGISREFKADKNKYYEIFGRKLETLRMPVRNTVLCCHGRQHKS